MKRPALWETDIIELGDGTVLVECGPMRMFLAAWQGSVSRPDRCSDAARQAVAFLEQIAAGRSLMHAPARDIPRPVGHPLLRVMWEAAILVGDPDLTPMAAVAGTIADATADYLVGLGMTRVVVNNGGDVALRLVSGERLSVGIRPDVTDRRISHRVVLTPELHVGGVCTSGLGGRSLTRGVASAATVFACRAAVSDAAATAVANATLIAIPAVERRRAEEIDPDTDIKGLDVTVTVGNLSETEIAAAIDQGIRRADRLIDEGVIAGACVAVKGRMECTEAFAQLVEKIRGQGDMT